MFSPNTYLIFSIVCFSLIVILRLFARLPSSKVVGDLKIPKKKFVLLVLDWCSSNLGNQKKGYLLEVKYCRSKEFAGYYFNHTRKIQIFVYDELDLLDLTEITIHEYIHHLQYANKKTDVEYSKYQSEVGYWNNPFEIEARDISKKMRNLCYDDIVKSNRVV